MLGLRDEVVNRLAGQVGESHDCHVDPAVRITQKWISASVWEARA